MVETAGELLDGGLHIGTQFPTVLGYSLDVPTADRGLRPAFLEVECSFSRMLYRWTRFTVDASAADLIVKDSFPALVCALSRYGLTGTAHTVTIAD